METQLNSTAPPFSRHQDPKPTRVEPARGPAAGGTVITITGKELDTASQEDVAVSVGRVPCQVYASSSYTSYTSYCCCSFCPSNPLSSCCISCCTYFFLPLLLLLRLHFFLLLVFFFLFCCSVFPSSPSPNSFLLLQLVIWHQHHL